MANSKTHFIGIWYFNDEVNEEQLKRFAVNNWLHDSNYLHIYTRRINPDKPDCLGLGFTYQNHPPQSYQIYFQQTLELLQQNFHDQLVGWNIASTATLIC